MNDPWLAHIWLTGIGPWWWLALGVAFLTLEIVASGFVLLWFGAGAVMAGLVFFAVSPPLDQQLILYAVLSVLCLLVGRPALLRRHRNRVSDDNGLNMRGASLIGSTAVLITPLIHGRGRVRVSDGEWSAQGNEDIPAGAMVRIVALEGNTLHVTPSAMPVPPDTPTGSQDSS